MDENIAYGYSINCEMSKNYYDWRAFVFLSQFTEQLKL